MYVCIHNINHQGYEITRWPPHFADSWPFLTMSSTGGIIIDKRFFRGGGFHSDPPWNMRISSVLHVSGESPCTGKRGGGETETLNWQRLGLTAAQSFGCRIKLACCGTIMQQIRVLERWAALITKSFVSHKCESYNLVCFVAETDPFGWNIPPFTMLIGMQLCKTF